MKFSGSKSSKNSEKRWRKTLRGEAKRVYKWNRKLLSSKDKKESMHDCIFKTWS